MSVDSYIHLDHGLIRRHVIATQMFKQSSIDLSSEMGTQFWVYIQCGYG